METICIKCQILFSGKKKKKNIINLSSAEILPRVLSIKVWRKETERQAVVKNQYL